MSEVFSVFAVKSLQLELWTTLLGPPPDDSVINLTAISTRIMHSIFDNHNGSIDDVSKVVVKIVLNELILTYTVSPTTILPKLLERLLV